MSSESIGKVLVANRGEIALRIIRGIHDQGLRAVAVYADQDRDASYVAAADEAFALDGTSPAQTYLNADKLLEIAGRAGADAVHPGYGFLAESSTFAAAVEDAGLIWIGPKPASIEALGDKVKAREVASRVGVRPVPGIDGALCSRSQAEQFIETYGYPVVMKRADGGGGRGITALYSAVDLDNFFSGRDEANFGEFFIEKFVERARHIETQCGRDQSGNFTVYSTRDCTVQRRHQKLIEEAPAPGLAPKSQKALIDASQKLFEGVDYRGLGTCEFLLDPSGEVYFLEVNPRLQVEHTVTEEVSGIDLVGQQLRIAAGKDLTAAQAPRGHSIELRITTEDPRDGLTPSSGRLTTIDWPTGPGIRIDTGVEAGDEVAPDFDSMVAKLIVSGEDRDHALRRARRALTETQIEGVGTPIPLYRAILDDDQFQELTIWTRWLEEHFLDEFLETYQEDPGTSPDPLRMRNGVGPSKNGANEPGKKITRFAIEVDGKRHEIGIPTDFLRGSGYASTRPPQPIRAARSEASEQAGTQDPNKVISPLQAIVVRICVEPGEAVAKGQLVAVLESMKMEKYVNAGRAGVVEDVLVTTGENVAAGQVLVELAKESS